MKNVNVFEISTPRIHRSHGIRWDTAVREGSPLVDEKIVLGEEGRGRKKTAVGLPPEAVVKGKRLVSLPLPFEGAVLVVVRNLSGFRGGWELYSPRTDADWDSIVRRECAHCPPDGFGSVAVTSGHDFDGPARCRACRELFGEYPLRRPVPEGIVLASGWCAQGAAGRMGGGPEYLVLLRPGQSVEAVRWGRLYGGPDAIRITCSDGSVAVADPHQAARDRLAADVLASVAK